MINDDNGNVNDGDTGIGGLLDMADAYLNKEEAQPKTHNCAMCKQDSGLITITCHCGHEKTVCLVCTIAKGIEGIRKLSGELTSHEKSCKLLRKQVNAGARYVTDIEEGEIVE